VGLLSDFFVARPDEVVSVLEMGPEGTFPTVEAQNVETVKIATLSAIATGRDGEIETGGFERLLDEIDEVAALDEDGPWVYRVPPPLSAALGAADETRLREIAREWGATEEWAIDGLTEEHFEDLELIVVDLGRLARTATPETPLFLWLCL
jgi:hypothetical protein